MYSVSLNLTLQIEPSVHTISLHTTNFLWLSLKTLEEPQIQRRILVRKFTLGTVREFPANCLKQVKVKVKVKVTLRLTVI
jgi:hypothetical protein